MIVFFEPYSLPQKSMCHGFGEACSNNECSSDFHGEWDLGPNYGPNEWIFSECSNFTIAMSSELYCGFNTRGNAGFR